MDIFLQVSSIGIALLISTATSHFGEIASEIGIILGSYIGAFIYCAIIPKSFNIHSSFFDILNLKLLALFVFISIVCNLLERKFSFSKNIASHFNINKAIIGSFYAIMTILLPILCYRLNINYIINYILTTCFVILTSVNSTKHKTKLI